MFRCPLAFVVEDVQMSLGVRGRDVPGSLRGLTSLQGITGNTQVRVRTENNNYRGTENNYRGTKNYNRAIEDNASKRKLLVIQLEKQITCHYQHKSKVE